MTFLLYLWMAFAPCLALALYVYWRDKHEKEPVGILVKCFFLGAMITFPAGYSNLFGAEVLGFEMRGENGLAVSFFMAFFVVGFGEEFWKFLVLVFFAFPKSSFNEPFDGIVYSVMIGLGFAALEKPRLRLGLRYRGSSFKNGHCRAYACCFRSAYGLLCWNC